jgi:flagellar protein FlaF
LQAASRLQAARDTAGRGRPELHDALLYNRKLWSIFLTSVISADHPLPAAVRENVANLGVFVMKQTVTTLTDPRPEQLRPLIAINRQVAAGLMGRA